MRIAILSDIHANPAALQAVLADSVEMEVERYWCLGDLVGYGPEPVAPLLWLKHYVDPADWVIGNHDAMLAGLLSDEQWAAVNATPKKAIDLNKKQLAADEEANTFWLTTFDRERLQPRRHTLNGRNHLLIHSGQVNNPIRYIYPWQTDFFLPAECERLQALVEADGRPFVQWIGHTHVPMLILAQPADEGFIFTASHILPGETYSLQGDLVLVNPGSVGQPRDLDQRAAYAVLDSEAQTVTFRRVAYELQTTILALVKAWSMEDYPSELIRRLRQADATKETPAGWLAHYQQAREVGR